MTDATFSTRTQAAAPGAAEASYIVCADADLDAVEATWRALEENGEATAFQTRAWLRPWFDVVAPAFGAAPLAVTVFERGSLRPLMLLILSISRRQGLTRIEFPDMGVSDYNAPLLAADFAPSEAEFAAIWAQIIKALPKADVIALEKMPAVAGALPNPLTRLKGSRPMRVRCWELPLPASREDYDKALKKNVRKEMRRKRRNLEREGALKLAHAETEAHGREIFETHRRQRIARGTPVGGTGPDAETFSRFYDAVLFDGWGSGFGRLSALTVDDEIAATLFAVRHRGRYVLLAHCFETGRWGTASPGIVAIDWAITEQIEAGAPAFDFTIGNETYKLQFGVVEGLLYFHERSLSLKGRVHQVAREIRRFIGDLVRKLPKKHLPKRFHE